MTVRRRPVWQLRFLAIVFGLLAPLLVAEVILQFAPTRRGLRRAPVNASDPVMHYEPGKRFTYSIGWNFPVVVRGRTNNFGFTNERDYDSTATTPMVAVVGDSYVEALMVPHRETLQGILAEHLGERGRVYSFGMSGAPLSQYLMMTEMARRFRPTGLVVVVVGNDFDESVTRYSQAPGMHRFVEQADGTLHLVRFDYTPVWWRRALGRSALAEYFLRNLRGDVAVGRLRQLLTGGITEAYVGNTVGAADSLKLSLSQRVVDTFFEMLPERSGLEPSRIVIVVDGRRPHLYDQHRLRAADGSYFDQMRRYLSDAGRARGFEVLDLEPTFIERHRSTGVVFEFPWDAHWSGWGHAVAAEAVLASNAWSRWFPAE